MFGRLAIKSSLLGSFGSVAYASTIIDIPDNGDNKPLSPKITPNQKRNYTTQDATKVTIEDIEMFQQNNGCKLIFTDKFEEKKNYTVREWFNEKMRLHPEKEKTWRDALAVGVVYQKGKWNCKKGMIFVLESKNSNNDDFVTKFTFQSKE